MKSRGGAGVQALAVDQAGDGTLGVGKQEESLSGGDGRRHVRGGPG